MSAEALRKLHAEELFLSLRKHMVLNLPQGQRAFLLVVTGRNASRLLLVVIAHRVDMRFPGGALCNPYHAMDIYIFSQPAFLRKNGAFRLVTAQVSAHPPPVFLPVFNRKKFKKAKAAGAAALALSETIFTYKQ